MCSDERHSGMGMSALLPYRVCLQHERYYGLGWTVVTVCVWSTNLMVFGMGALVTVHAWNTNVFMV